RDDSGRIVAVWSRDGSLRTRTRATTGVWDAEAQLTPPPTGEGDREPALIITGGQRRVYYRSERNLAVLTVRGASAVLMSGAPLDSWPAPVEVDGAVALLHRSDRSVALAPNTGTARRHAGSVTVPLSDAERIARKNTADDLLAYTPNQPAGGPVGGDEPYTRCAAGPFVPATDRTRPRAAAARFLPVNTRVIIRTGS